MNTKPNTARRALSLLALLLALLAVAGCTPKNNAPAPATAASGQTAAPGTKAGTEAATNATRPTGTVRTAVVCFSRTDHTWQVAQHVAQITGADVYRIEAKVPYTDADIDYTNASSRTSLEQNDPNARPEMAGEVPDLSGYDVIYLGYPIWWGQAPKILYTFLDACDLSGKTVVPFCTSASSGVGTSASNLAAAEPGATWLAGKRFPASASRGDVAEWIASLGL